MLTGTSYGPNWSEVDRLLAAALVVLERSVCGGCGQSLLRSADEDAIGHLEVHDLWCEGCVQLGRDADLHTDPPAGRKPYLVDTGNI